MFSGPRTCSIWWGGGGGGNGMGESYFMQCLVDAEIAATTAGWPVERCTGTDAEP
jgi:hypothetical protein